MKAVGYVRVSSEEQAQRGLSLEAQREAIEGYAKLKGLDLVAMIEDAGVSGGKSLAQRDGGAKLLEILRKGEAQAVIAVKLDRLFRSSVDALTTLEAWQKKGIAVHIVDLGGMPFDSASAVGKFLLSVLVATSEMERNLIRERTKAVLDFKKANGEPYNHEPLGFRREGNRLLPDPFEQKVIERILVLRSQGLSLRQIARKLTLEGIPTKRGRPQWSAEMVRRVLRTREVKGVCQTVF